MSARRRPVAAGSPRVSVSGEGVRAPVSAARLAAAAERVLRSERTGAAMLCVTLLTPRRMAAMNRRHLGRRGPTDVIAFGFRDPGGAVVGDVYLCPAIASANAKRLGVPVREEVLRLVVHGTLHVLGHAHPEDDTRMSSPMWARQERLLRQVLRT